MKRRLKYPLIVEGKYDKATLSNLVEGEILLTDGFHIYKNKEMLSLLRQLAQNGPVAVLTDSDRAGFSIRGHLAGAIPPERLIQVYIPEIYGKERRKTAPSAEGKLGVEGMTPEVILAALRNAGATIEGEETTSSGGITKQDLMALGLSGGSNAGEKRKALLKKLNLPEHMSANAMLQALNLLYTREELEQMLDSSGIERD